MEFTREQLTVKGHAAVIYSKVELKVQTKLQAEAIVRYCVENNYEFSFDIEGEESIYPTYFITILEIIWADNLVHLANFLVTIDYPQEI